MKTLWRKRSFTLPVLLAVGIIIGLGLSLNFDRQPASLAEKSRVPMDTRQQLDTISTALSEVAAAVSPSVVNVSTTRMVAAPGPPAGMYDNPLFRRFFEPPPSSGQGGAPQRRDSLGSGVIVSENGHILTNNHVIEEAEKISVTLQDKRVFEAELLGADPKTDLALLKIDAVDLPALVLNEENDLKAGEIVVAVGIPFGLSHTVTMGIVSAVGRSNIGIVDYEDFIQTDAAINPGNSGGALVNSAGELVGINTAIFSTSGGNMGVGFAIPVQMAATVMDSLLEHGKVIRGWLGVSIQPITPEIADYFKLEERRGALIAQVVEGSPAAKAGLQEGDVVISFAGREITEPNDLKNMAASTPPGEEREITVIRKGEEKTMQLTMGEYPDEDLSGAGSGDGKFYGAHLQNLSPELKQQLGIGEDVTGVLIVEVDSDSPAAGVLSAGDIIMQVNREPVSSREQLFRVVRQSRQGDSVLLLVLRGGRSLYLTLSP